MGTCWHRGSRQSLGRVVTPSAVVVSRGADSVAPTRRAPELDSSARDHYRNERALGHTACCGAQAPVDLSLPCRDRLEGDRPDRAVVRSRGVLSGDDRRPRRPWRATFANALADADRVTNPKMKCAWRAREPHGIPPHPAKVQIDAKTTRSRGSRDQTSPILPLPVPALSTAGGHAVGGPLASAADFIERRPSLRIPSEERALTPAASLCRLYRPCGRYRSSAASRAYCSPPHFCGHHKSSVSRLAPVASAAANGRYRHPA